MVAAFNWNPWPGSSESASGALGSLSLIFWLLIITISIKYCLFVMRADNHGEGGILALMSLTHASWHGRGRALVIMGLFGAALIYGDGIITPAISVLSALEGLNQHSSAVGRRSERPHTFWDRFENPSSVRCSPIAGEPRSLAQPFGAKLL
jgi:hypothetical protein